MPIPQSVEASTQKSIGLGGGGQTREDPQNRDDNCDHHYTMSNKMVAYGDLRTKSE